MRPPSQGVQILASILVALAIAAIAIAVVTAKFGPTSHSELEAREERIDQRLDAREERAKDREDRRAEAAKQAER